MELIDYVTNTPQNTNRTILKQLVNSEKNKAVYESVEELKRDGGVGYMEGNKTEILPEQTVPVNEELEGYILDFTPQPGKVYTVVVDGVEYKCEAKSTTMDGSELVVLGNAIIYGVPGNGEPWVIAYTFEYQMCAFGWMDGSDTDPTVTIYEGADMIHPIDPKYLVKEINLNDYLVGDSSLGMVILMAGMTGQKVVTPVTIPAQFFADCDVESPLRFIIDASLDGGIAIRQEFDGICKNYMNGQLSQISYSFVSWFNNTLFEGSVSILPGAIIVNSAGTAASFG